MSFEVTILGANSALPSSTKHTTSQLLNYNHNYMLIDCGEGTQMQLRANGFKIQSINHIFISHLHGDHFFGLIGLLSTMSLLGRVTDINIFAPEPLLEIINIQLKASGTWLNYKLNFTSLSFDKPKKILDYKGIQITSFPVQHKINCCGFLFKEAPKPRKINKVMVTDHNVPLQQLKNITEGGDFTTENGDLIKNELLTFNPTPIRSYAFCADTRYFDELSTIIKECNVIYHEATFLHELIERAQKTKHSTALQAATVAKKAKAHKLLIGHFSSRYKKYDNLLNEAKSVFDNTFIAEQNKTYKI